MKERNDRKKRHEVELNGHNKRQKKNHKNQKIPKLRIRIKQLTCPSNLEDENNFGSSPNKSCLNDGLNKHISENDLPDPKHLQLENSQKYLGVSFETIHAVANLNDKHENSSSDSWFDEGNDALKFQSSNTKKRVKKNSSSGAGIKPPRKKQKSDKEISKEKLILVCQTCGRQYQSRKALSNHIRNACGKRKSVSLQKCIMSECQRFFHHKSKMLEHLKEDHNYTIDEELLYFKNRDEFLVWKAKEERAKFVYFSKRSKEKTGGLYAYFVCQHDGQSYSHRKSNEPPRKTSRRYRRGSARNNQICFARMNVKYLSDKVEVRYISSHSHEISLKNTEYQPIPPEVKKHIAALLAQGISPREVKSKLQEKLSERDQRDAQNHMKVQHLNLQMVYQMKYRMTQSKTTISQMVEKLREESYDPVLIFKPVKSKMVVGSCNPSDIDNFNDFFVIGIQTKEQRDVLLKETAQIISIVCFRDTNIPGYFLYSFLLRDEFGTGYPTAHFITNQRTEATLTMMLKSLEQRCKTFRCDTVITEDDPSVFNSMLSAFGPEKSGCLLYFQQNVCQSWQKLLSEKVHEKGLRSEIYKKLLDLMNEQNEQNFHMLVQQFCENYYRKEPSVIEFFKMNYCSYVKLWATCYRFQYQVNSDSFIEHHHERLKAILSNKVCKKVDDLLGILLNMEVDAYVERKKKMAPPAQNTQVILPNRHKSSLKICHDDVTKGVLPNTWYIKSEKLKEQFHYVITRQSEKCLIEFCNDKCFESVCINLCNHLYSCTCPDRASLCKHIHKIHSLINQNSSTIQHVSRTQNKTQELFPTINPSYDCEMITPSFSQNRHEPQQLPSSNSVDVPAKQLAMEYEKLCKLIQNPEVKKTMLDNILGTIQQTVRQCESLASKSVPEPAPVHANVFQPQQSSVWAWPQCQY